MSAPRANPLLSFSKICTVEIISPKDTRDFSRNEMPLKESPGLGTQKGMEEGRLGRLPEIGHRAGVLCLMRFNSRA